MSLFPFSRPVEASHVTLRVYSFSKQLRKLVFGEALAYGVRVTVIEPGAVAYAVGGELRKANSEPLETQSSNGAFNRVKTVLMSFYNGYNSNPKKTNLSETSSHSRQQKKTALFRCGFIFC